jgi:outer membrane autotransporter protein
MLQAQAQLIAQHIRQGDTQATGTTIAFDEPNTVTARVGLALDLDIDPRTLKAWLRADYWSELSGEARTTFTAPSGATTVLVTAFDDRMAELTAGITARINATSSMHASVTTSQGLGGSNSHALQGTIGFNVQW